MAAPSATGRVIAIDAFRGFTMMMMVSEGFGLRFVQNHAWVVPIAQQFEHVDWIGMSSWDLIQPFFMFIVGAVMPWSFAARWSRGESWNQSLRHVLKRSVLLLLWGTVARSIRAGRPIIDVINVLGQLAFTYPVAFLVLRRSQMFQLSVGLALLAVHAVAYLAYGNAWTVGENLGEAIDRAIFGKNWGGHYATINCVSSAFNTILGVMTGEMIRERAFRKLAALGGACLAAGLLLSLWIPIIKKIWTASFALVSGGITIFALLLFWWLCEQKGWKMRLAVMVGANSIFIYLFHEILGEWLYRLGHMSAAFLANFPDGRAVLSFLLVFALQIAVCMWLYLRGIFFKL